MKHKCAPKQVQESSWNRLKTKINEAKLDTKVGRTMANCLQFCRDGPIAVVYDYRGGTWYKHCVDDNLDRIIESHLKNDVVVKDLEIPEAQNMEILPPLSSCS